MTRADPVAPLIPWYANGTLDSASRRSVEQHLTTCASCRALLESARLQAAQSNVDAMAAMQRHVHPRLLTMYAEEPEAIEEETARWIEGKLDSCATCREAYERMLEVGTRLALDSAEAAPPVAAQRDPLARIWGWLSSTLLRPAPALAYLLLLVLIVPWLWRDEGRGSGTAPLRSPAVVPVEGERATRAAGVDPDAPLVLESSGDTVLLELRTELTVEDLADPGLDYSVELERDGSRLWSERRALVELVPREGSVIVPVVLDPGVLEAGVRYDVLLRVRKPGDPLDGQALFRRALIVQPPKSR